MFYFFSVCCVTMNQKNKMANLLLLSVRVIPCEDTLKWTTVGTGRVFRAIVHLIALETASGPVNDSVSTEFR